MPRSRRTIRTPTNCRMRSISVSERSKRRGPSSKLDRSSTIRPRSPAPASSSASMPKGCCRSTAATCGRRMRHPPSSILRATHRATVKPATDQRPMARSSVRSSPSAARRPNPSRRRRRHCQAAAGSAHHRADRASDAGIAQCTGKRIRHSPSRRCCTISCWQRSIASRRRTAAWRSLSGRRRSPPKPPA